MTVLHALITFLLVACGGLIVGFFAGIVTAVCLICRQREQGPLMPTYTDKNNPTPGHIPWRGREHLSRVGWVLVLAGLLGFVGGVVGLVQSNSTASCLRDYIEQSSVVNQERGAAGELDRQAIRQQRAVTQEFNDVMIHAVTNPVTDEAGREAARQDFLTKAQDWNARLAEVERLDQQAEKQRRENPLPEQPNC